MTAPADAPDGESATVGNADAPAMTAEEAEREWVATVFAGEQARQLTVRAVVTGMLLGGLMALSNLYVNLKTGWSLGVTITAAILAFGIWSLIRKVIPSVEEFGPLENNAMQSVASAAGYMTGGGTVAAIPALMMMTGYRFDPVWMMVWIGAIAFLGVFVAIPLKRQLVNVEKLRFPTGLAAAETVKSLHAEGGDARFKARALGVSAGIGAIVPILRDALHFFPDRFALFGSAAATYTIEADASLIMVGVGAIMGLRAVLSQLLGSFICYAVLAPWAHAHGAIADPVKYKSIVAWSVWIGSTMMLTAGLLQFAFQWRSLKRAVVDLALLFRPSAARADDPVARIEVPTAWFGYGFAVFAPLTVWLEHRLFAIPIWMGLLTVLLSLVIALVAARSTGETDTTPTGAMGKLVQLIFGVLHPGNVTTNLMSAEVSAGVAIHASDLLTDLKSGYVLGAKPRHQFFAQFFGVLAGTIVVVPVYMLLIPDASAIGGDKYPAPAAQTWSAVAKMMALGVSSIHPTARIGLVIGGAVGIVLVLLERVFSRHKRFIPSPIALGLAFTIPAWNTISMAFGGLAAWALEARRPKLAALLVIAAASGFIAGESLLGVFIGLGSAVFKR